ncbi:MAG: hypothetical protein N2260_00535 [Syntrophobacterales bacterium]|nr:hypothetical protein [Syntrophobacterales bacterium]
MVTEEYIIGHVKKLWKEAEERLESKREGLFSNKDFAFTFRSYELAIEETAKAMEAFGVWDECARCGSSPKGSCCAPEVASWYDIETLMVNILMRCTLPSRPFYPNHCLFLGERGCLLKARHYYCVHFLCPEIEGMLGPSKKELLRKIIGEELFWGSKVISNLLILA